MRISFPGITYKKGENGTGQREIMTQKVFESKTS